MKRKSIIAVAAFLVLSFLGVLLLFLEKRPGELLLEFPELSGNQKGFIDPLVTAYEIETGRRIRYSFNEPLGLYEELQNGVPAAHLYYVINNRQLEILAEGGALGEIHLRRNENVSDLFYENPCYLPVSWYPWGVYYNVSLFRELGLEEPASIEDFSDLEKKAAEAGRPLFSLMNKIKWPSTLLFDYLDLQINGKDFHKELLAGNIPLTDDRVKTVAYEILRLHKDGLIFLESESTDWKSMIDAVGDGKSLMHISGTFFYEQADRERRNDFGWFPYPGSKTLVAASSGFVIPKNGKNRRAARKFLEFALSEKGQEIIQRNSNLIGVNKAAASQLDRADVSSAIDKLDGYESMVPSFERYCQGRVLVPFKSFINGLYGAADEEDVDARLESLEDFRRSLSEKQVY